jgi:thiol:disulfide interchange protein DsbD
MMSRLYYLLLLVCILPLKILAANEPLPIEQAFNIKADYVATGVRLRFHITKGHYLYRDRIKVENTQKPVPLALPAGIAKHNEFLGNYEVYDQPFALIIVLDKTRPANLTVQYQGCAKNGFCYPPQTRVLSLGPNQITINTPDSLPATEQDIAAGLLAKQNYTLIILGFFGFGLLLSFTPCVFPMLPILSGIIVGQGQDLSLKRAWQLSLTYVLAMSFTYAIAGIAAAYAGSQLQTALQTPWVIQSFSILFILLAMSLFDVYQLQLPATIQHKLTYLSHRQRSGSYIGVAIMGILATLIVSPCVSAPLVGALSYISQTGNLYLGGTALFSLGLGIGLPLLIIGTSAGKLLPKAGHWLTTIKKTFGFMLLGMAIWLLARIYPHWLINTLWGILLCGTGSYIYYGTKNRQWLGLFFSVALMLSGLLLVVYSLNQRHYLQPQHSLLSFQLIHTEQELYQALSQSKKPVMVDVYADWCIACKDMEQKMLNDAGLLAQLQRFTRLKIDVTRLDVAHKLLLQSLKVIAPPTFIFFEAGQRTETLRLVGDMEAAKLTRYLQTLK